MQIKIIRRLKDAFIFHFPTYLSISSSLFAPLCSSLLLAVAAFTRVTPFARRVSRSFRFFYRYRVTGSPPFSFPSSTPVLYLVLWWRHYFNSLFSCFFSSYGDDDGVAVLFTLLPCPRTMHGAFSAAFTAAFLFQTFVTLKRLLPGKLGVSFMRREQSLWSFNFVISGERRGETPIRFSFSSSFFSSCYFVFKRNATTLCRILFRTFDKETRCCAVEIEIYSASSFSTSVVFTWLKGFRWKFKLFES